jgi:phosphinothricin acetyltransferase
MATVQDAGAILDIYRPYIETTTITFETQQPSLRQFEERISGITELYPYIVCQVNGETAGYAYAHSYRERAAYRWNAELSVYVRQGLTGRKIGTALYRALIAILELQQVQNVYACITHPNTPSERFHTALGFSLVGIYRKVGYKCDKWLDVAWYEKFIGSHANPPAPLLSVHELDAGRLALILS